MKLNKSMIIYILITLFFIVLAIHEFNQCIVRETFLINYRYLIYFLITLVCSALSFLIYYAFTHKWKIENIFLVLIIPLGLLYSLFMPLARVPDEREHFLKAYQIARGNLYASLFEDKSGGDYLPSSINEPIIYENDYRNAIKTFYLHESIDSVPVKYTSMAVYSFIIHTPQAVGVMIGNIFNTSIAIKGYLGRITNFIFYIVLMYFALKYLPFKKFGAFFVLLLPMAIQQNSSLSADVMINSCSFLFISYILYLKYDDKSPKVLETKHKLMLSLLALIISLSKIVYFPICLLLFLIPKEKFSSPKRKRIEIIILLLICLFLNIFTSLMASNFLVDNLDDINYKGQMIYVLTHPWAFIMAILRSLKAYWFGYIKQFISSVGVWDIYIPKYYSYVLPFILLSVFFSDYTYIKKNYNQLYLLLFFLIFMMIAGIEYLTYSDYMGKTVEGIQGRYFMPLVIPLLLGFNNKKINLNIEKYQIYYILVIVMVDICILGRIFYKYL